MTEAMRKILRAIQTQSNGESAEGLPLAAMMTALVVLFFGGLIQSMTYLNHDVAWVLYSAERLLDGGTFGSEIIAANPPLIWWINVPVVWLARLLETDPINSFRAVVLMILTISLAASDRILSTSGMHPRKRAGLLIGLALILTLGVNRDFGQREHLALSLCLPWLLIMARRVEGIAPSWAGALVAGTAAGIAICLKPHFLAVPVLAGLFVAFRCRSLRQVLSLESAAIVLTGVFYLAATWAFARPYLTEVVPLISQIYWGFSHSLTQEIFSQSFPIILCFTALIVGWKNKEAPAAMITALAALGFLVAALAQAKGYTYHIYPVVALTLMSLALSVLASPLRRFRAVATGALAGGLLLMTLQSTAALGNRMAGGAYGRTTACLVDMVKLHVPKNASFMAFSTHPYPGFPVANYSQRRWVATTNSRLPLPAIVRLRAAGDLQPQATRVLALAEAAERAAALKDMGQRPSLVFVDNRTTRHAIGTLPTDFIKFYTEDPDFARIWSNYYEINTCAPGIRAFKLLKES
ncbi:hypothetical protein [Celeribacter halophilus]|uniref:hypothetical protein n=1 Tax=Celeribacter halophilus TaxID=576117 RepID=UPI001C08DEDE|nr:hypothetical protein [Celeribacter halophilus]MBU2888815.1 hypothetical protein [Celeribacter halophilus]MDO6511812.1 hypothetical protein [Celeribacter halophilus]